MKRLLLFSTLFLLSIFLTAQSRWAFGLDIEGGVSGKKEMSDDHYSDPSFGSYSYREVISRRPGMSAGVWAEYLVSNRFGMRLGVNYARLMAFSSTESNNYNAEGGMTYFSRSRLIFQQRQLRVPLETKLYFGPADQKVRAFVSAGAQVSYLFAQRTITDNYYGGVGQSEAYEETFATDLDMKNEYLDIKRTQVTLISGLGITADRYTLSLQRTWGAKADVYEAYLGGLCNCVLCDCAFPYYWNLEIKQLQLTSLRFAYRLF